MPHPQPLEVVLAERVAERHQSSPGLCSTAAGVSAAKAGGSNARSPRWGANGRRVPGRELSQFRCNGACAECHKSCSASGDTKGNSKAAGTRVMRSNDRSGKKAAVSRRQRPKAGIAAPPTPSASPGIADIFVPVDTVAAESEGHEATNLSASNHARLEFFDKYDHGRGDNKSDEPLKNHERRRRQSARRQRRTTEEEHREVCFACGMESSALPPEENLETSGRYGRREEGKARAADCKEARYDLGQQVLSSDVISTPKNAPSTTSSAAYHTRARVDRTPMPPSPPKPA